MQCMSFDCVSCIFSLEVLGNILKFTTAVYMGSKSKEDWYKQQALFIHFWTSANRTCNERENGSEYKLLLHLLVPGIFQSKDNT